MNKVSIKYAQKKAIGYTSLIVLMLIAIGVLFCYYPDIMIAGLSIIVIGMMVCAFIVFVYYTVLHHVKNNQKANIEKKENL